MNSETEMMNQNEGVNSNALITIESKKRDFDGDTDKNSDTLKILLKLPKSLIQSIEFIVFITNRTQNDLLTEFLIHELNTYLYDHSSAILSLFEKNGVLELMRCGVRQYFGEEYQAMQENDIEPKIKSLKWKSMNLELTLNKKIIRFIEKYCKLSNISKAEFTALLITARLDCIRTCPEMILDYVKNIDKFFEELKEGVKDYYGNTIIERKK